MFASDEMMSLSGYIIVTVIAIAVLMAMVLNSGGSMEGICRSMVGAIGDMIGGSGFQCS